MGREVNELDWALEIEGPAEYRGYRLDPNMRMQLTKVLFASFIQHSFGNDCIFFLEALS